MDIPTPPPLYESDFAAWCAREAERLRAAALAGSNLPLDWDHLAEEVDSLGRSELHAVHAALERIIEHVLKLTCSPATDPRSGWRESVARARADAHRHLDDSPSLYRRLNMDRCWRAGRKFAALGLASYGEPTDSIPADCPWTLDQLLDEDWWPEPQGWRQGWTP